MNKEDAKKLFGINLKRLRTERGMSQEELAKKLGYKGRSAINKIETGVNDMPREMVVRCADALGVSPLDLFFYEQLPGVEDIHVKTNKELLKDSIDMQVQMQKESMKSIKAVFDEAKTLPEGKLQQLLSYIKFLKQEG